VGLHSLTPVRSGVPLAARAACPLKLARARGADRPFRPLAGKPPQFTCHSLNSSSSLRFQPLAQEIHWKAMMEAAKQKIRVIFPLAAQNGFVFSNPPVAHAVPPPRLGSFRQLPPTAVGFVFSNLTANSHPGLEPKNETRISPLSSVSPTSRWAWPSYSYETASDSLVQRYYTATAGRFYTPDPSTGVDLQNPITWNKYVYVNDDPVNFYDRRGTDWDDPNLEQGPDGGGDIAGGGCLGCFVNPFDPPSSVGDTGSCAPPILLPPPVEPVATAPPPCFVELKYRPVPNVPANHAYLWVEDSNGQIHTIEGFPDKPQPDYGYLRAYDTPNGRLGTNAHGDSQWDITLDTSNDPLICSQVNNLFSLEKKYNSNPVQYFLASGPNSNSLAPWFLVNDGLGNCFTAPPATTAWDTSIYP